MAKGDEYEDIEQNCLSADSTDYLVDGNIIYKNNCFSKILFDGGFIGTNSGTGPTRPIRPVGISDGQYHQQLESWMQLDMNIYGYNFYNKDHLGNIREIVDKNGNIIQKTDYYPYGTPILFDPFTINDTSHPYKYNGKELDMMHGLNTYDYGARQYYSALPLWDRVDPLAEKYYSISPYAYCANNPVNFVDPDGKEKKKYLNAYETKYSDYNLYPDHTPGVLNIWAHGVKSDHYAHYAWAIKAGTNISNAISFHENVLTSSSEWKESEGKNLTIVLHSCATSELAKKLSENELFKDKNIVFIAPNATLVTNQNGSRVNDKVFIKKNSTKVIKKESGKWIVYRDGVQIGTLPATAQPGLKGKNRRVSHQDNKKKE